MGMSLGQAILDLVANDAQLRSDVDSARSKVASSMTTIGTAMTQAGTRAALGLTLPLLGVGGAALNASSDLEESMNAVKVVFGEASDTVLGFSQDAAESAGLAASEFNQMAAQTGAMLVNMGYSQEEAADQAINLTQRAADMASIFNTDVSQALGAIQAGLRGEADPLEKFGVRLAASAVSAKAVEMGLAEATSEVDLNAKAQASLALLYDQTNSMAGDFTNTSDQLANSTRIAKAELSNQAAALGRELLPVALQVVTAIRGLLDRFSNLSPQMRKNIVIIGGIVAAVGPLLMFLGTMITTIGTLIGSWGTITAVLGAVAGVLTGPVALAIALIVALVAGLYLAWKNNFLGIRDTFNVIWQAIKNIFAAFKAAFQGDWYAFGEYLRKAWDLIWNLIKERFLAAKEALFEVAKKAVEAIKKAFEIDWGQLGLDIIKGIARGITNSLQWIKDAAIKAAKAALAAAKGFLGIKSPSKLMEKEVGWEMGMGIKVGWEKSLFDLRRAVNASLGGLMPAGAGAAVGAAGGFGGGNHETHLHVGVLVADERGLRELERRLRPIRNFENQRTGTE
mgnify:CR=1 FL=1